MVSLHVKLHKLPSHPTVSDQFGTSETYTSSFLTAPYSGRESPLLATALTFVLLCRTASVVNLKWTLVPDIGSYLGESHFFVLVSASLLTANLQLAIACQVSKADAIALWYVTETLMLSPRLHNLFSFFC